MSKWAVRSTLKSSCRYWTLFWPKYWAEAAGASARHAAAMTNPTTSDRERISNFMALLVARRLHDRGRIARMKKFFVALGVLFTAIGVLFTAALATNAQQKTAPPSPAASARPALDVNAALKTVAPDLEMRLARFKPVKMPYNAAALSTRERQMVDQLV